METDAWASTLLASVVNWLKWLKDNKNQYKCRCTADTCRHHLSQIQLKKDYSENEDKNSMQDKIYV